MSNYMIVNPDNNVYLAVTASTPAAGSKVSMLKIGEAETSVVSAFWTFESVSGGVEIRLSSNTNLCLDIDASSSGEVKNGTSLILSDRALPKFHHSNFWLAGPLSHHTLGKISQIESAGTAGDYVVNFGTSSKDAMVWTDDNNSFQNWQLLSVQ